MKHDQVREHLRALIESGLQVGAPLPSERELCKQFGVSRMTVRQATDALVNEGLLERVQGRGTFVSRPHIDLQLRLSSFAEEMSKRGLSPSARYLQAEETEADPVVATALETSIGVPVYHFRRVRYGSGMPISIQEDWMPAKLAPGLLTEGMPASLYATLKQHGMPPQWGEDTITTKLITDEEAELLEQTPPQAGLYVTRRTFSGETAVLCSKTLYRHDRYSLWVPVSSPSPTMSGQQLPNTRRK
ncbi:GntR family transcriptional regulator [Boudabousia tangfeifanii]|uniref:GntR family transcriptional regulator n=1 Tax=Boudabousia tangfeifanii TaxID=1912795 RepID=UPI003AAC9120